MPTILIQFLSFVIERPLLFLLAASVPFLILGFWRGVFPAPRLLALMSVPAVASFSQVAAPSVGWYVLLLDLMVVTIATLDMLSVAKQRQFQVRRIVNKIASLGKSQPVELELSYSGRRKCVLEITDDLPDEFTATPQQFHETVPPLSRTFFSYKLKSNARGLFRMACVHLRVHSRWRLWYGLFRKPFESELHAYPDLKQISEFDLLARTNRLNLLGVRKSRKVGQDNEFERLRDYSLDDNYRHIDWRTTARRQKLTVRDFQANQNQQIIFLIDCGRMMTGQADGISLLDHSLNAMLMLSYVALRQGDSVGLCLFSDRIHNFTPPRSGVKHVNRLLHASFDRHPEHVESRYDEAFVHLRKHCRKRSLVVLITNVIDEINANQIREYLTNTTGHHLALGVLLRDHSLFDPINSYLGQAQSGTPANKTRLFQAAAAAEIVQWRHQILTSLNQKGVLTLDVFPEQLTARIINRYLEIKVRHLL